MSNPKSGEVWLVAFPFTKITSTTNRPTLVISVHTEDVIILEIFSKITTTVLRETWVLMPESHPEFLQAALKLEAVIMALRLHLVGSSNRSLPHYLV